MTRNERKRNRNNLLFLAAATALALLVCAAITVQCAGLSERTSFPADEEPGVWSGVAASLAAGAPEEEAGTPSVLFGDLSDCRVTYYCCEKRRHICGTGNGITASGKEAAPGMCAMDGVPFGATVMVDYDADGLVDDYFLCEDRFGSSGSNRIDVAVETHQEALERGVRTGARIHWVYEENAAGEITQNEGE